MQCPCVLGNIAAFLDYYGGQNGGHNFMFETLQSSMSFNSLKDKVQKEMLGFPCTSILKK